MEKGNKKENLLKDFGFIAYIVERIFRFLSFWPPQILLKNRADYQRGFEKLSEEEKLAKTKKRAFWVDLYIAIWILVELSLIFVSASNIQQNKYLCGVLILILSLRLIDILQSNVNLSIFDYMRLKKINYVATIVRVLINVVINFLEIILCFGFIYSVYWNKLNNANDWTDGYYLSVVTQLTIGYGDISPTGILKILVSLQGLIGFFFSVLIISKLISLFPSVRTIMGDGGQDTHK